LFWRRLTTTHFDSWPEKRFLVKLALDSLCLQSLQPAKLGCLLRVTDPKSGKWAAHRKRSALLSVRGELVVAAFPQLSVWTGAQYRRPDLTLVVARRDKRVTAALEVDGDLYHRDAAKEEARDRELGIPVYHLNANQTGDSKTLEHFYQWCETLVA